MKIRSTLELGTGESGRGKNDIGILHLEEEGCTFWDAVRREHFYFTLDELLAFVRSRHTPAPPPSHTSVVCLKLIARDLGVPISDEADNVVEITRLIRAHIPLTPTPPVEPKIVWVRGGIMVDDNGNKIKPSGYGIFLTDSVRYILETRGIEVREWKPPTPALPETCPATGEECDKAVPR